MRIVVVSSHYPPSFVSGGTLQPQRLARVIKRRGHDVRVFAGWLGDSRPPLERWQETDAEGIPVDWVVTTPWIGWADRLNFENPGVASAFEAYLSSVSPDIVHFHSLQSFGAGLLPAAARTGARVVVTMHDFWWVCARQFLVDRSFTPCCLVVDAGVCECEVDRRWLAQRNAFLSRALEAADLVLAPSRSAARVLAANGIDGARLQVDENGLPEGGAGPAAEAGLRGDAAVSDEAGLRGEAGVNDEAGQRGDDDRAGQGGERALRLTYLGGPAEMKGIHVLLRAAKMLAPRPGWSLRAYGASSYTGAERAGLGGAPVHLLPGFSPDRLGRILAETDVLVVPSVMRETFSLATREALSAGVPVICTDTLGPEEVVQDSRNGLVVPAADPEALAGAIGSLIDSPARLGQLKAACVATPVRSVEEQADSLLTTFESLRTSTRPRRAGACVSRVLFACGIEGAPLRYRARLPAEALSLLGVHCDVRHYRDPDLWSLACRADVVVLYRVPATTQILDLASSARSLGIPLIFDVDDVIFDPEIADEIPALAILPPEEAELWMEGVRRYRTTMEACDLFVGSTTALCRHAHAVTGMPAKRFGNGVGLHLSRHSDAALSRERTPGPPRIGYLSGTTTHDRDWSHIEQAVIGVMAEHPDAELWLVGHLAGSGAVDSLGGRVRRIPFVRWDTLPYLVRDMDVTLAPLEPGSRFNEAKSAIKWLESGLVGTPIVASPTESFTEVIRDGENGVLAEPPEEWATAISRLLRDDPLRRAMGSRARRDALLDWSPHVQGRRYASILEEAIRSPRRTPSALWGPVVRDEPALDQPLEPYLFDPDAGEASTVWRGAAGSGMEAAPEPPQQRRPALPAAEALVRLSGRYLEAWRSEGLASATRRAAGALRRRVLRARAGSGR